MALPSDGAPVDGLGDGNAPPPTQTPADGGVTPTATNPVPPTAQAVPLATGSGLGVQQPNPILAAMAWLDNEDVNGECFLSGEVGEREELLTNRVIVFAQDTPAATAPGQKVTLTNVQMDKFLQINVAYLLMNLPQMTVPVAAKICWLRLQAVRAGLASPDFRPGDYNVQYNEAVRLSPTNLAKMPAQDMTPVRAALDKKTRDALRLDFANIVCCVAYMFRVRGHHYVDDMKEKYESLWSRCLKNAAHPGVEWRYIAHEAIHAIYPIVLDNYWKEHVTNGTIAGTLIKRFDAPPAGVAAVRAVYAGAEDLRMAMPGIVGKFKRHFEELDNMVATLKAERWRGSINRRYYGAGSVVFDEQKFGAIASVVWNCLLAFAASSPLLKSKALERVAQNAPITGGIISRSIATVASDPGLVKSMLIVEGDIV